MTPVPFRTAGSNRAHRSRASSGSVHTRHHRRSFTVVELLVVITIIGVLVALLIPAAYRVWVRAQQGVIIQEVAQLSQALQAFKSQYGTQVFPPDFSWTPQSSASGTAVWTDADQIDRYMQPLFRFRNPLFDAPPNAAGRPDRSRLNSLDPAEALWFWLRGFSKDPQRPLFGREWAQLENPAAAPEEIAPLFAFDQTRLTDVDGDGFMEFWPKNGKNVPYIYYSSQQYVEAYCQQPLIYNETLNTSGVQPKLAPRPYVRPPSGIAAADVATTLTEACRNAAAGQAQSARLRQLFAQPDSFQIISAGLDGDFGWQVVPNHALASAFYYPNGPYLYQDPTTGETDKAHKDNITNFAEGILEDKTQ